MSWHWGQADDRTTVEIAVVGRDGRAIRQVRATLAEGQPVMLGLPPPNRFTVVADLDVDLQHIRYPAGVAEWRWPLPL